MRLVIALLSVLSLPAWAIHGVTQTINKNQASPATLIDTPCFLVQTKAANLPGIIANNGDALAAVQLTNLFGAGDSTYICAAGAVAPVFSRTNDSVALGITITQTDPNNATYSASSLVTCAGCTVGIKAVNVNDPAGKTLTGSASVVASGSTAVPLADGSVNYFVCPTGGNDTNTGTSHNSPWATLSKVNGAFSSATTSHAKVWLCENSVFTGTLTIDWPGASNDYVVVGTYYVSGAAAFEGASTPGDLLSVAAFGLPVDGTRATIRGTFDPTCSGILKTPTGTTTCGYTSAQGPVYNGDNSIPSGTYSQLIHVTGSYVKVEHLAVKWSAGEGIRLDGSNDIIDDVHLEGSANSGISIHFSQRPILRNSYIEYTDQARPDGVFPNNGAAVTTIGGTGSQHNDPTFYNALVENNRISRVWGEGLDCFGGGRSIYRGNWIAVSASALLYCETSQENVVENNLIFAGTDANADGRADEAPNINPYGNPAIFIEQTYLPNWGDSTGNVWRNNVTVNVSKCPMSFGVQQQIVALGGMVGKWVVGNTCISGRTAFIDTSSSMTAANAEPGTIWENNAFDTIGTLNCAHPPPGVTYDYNAFPYTPANAACRGPHDKYDAVGMDLTGAINWPIAGLGTTLFTAHGANFPTSAQMKLGASSNYRTGAATLSDVILNVNNYPQKGDITATCFVSDDEWVKVDTFDFNCNARVNGWFGAFDQ